MLLFKYGAFWPLHIMVKTWFWLRGGTGTVGRENRPLKGACILACNHISLSDPVMLLATLPRPLYYMAKKELFEIPYFGKMITFMQAFPVNQEVTDLRALARCKKLLEAGEAVVIYPEGRLSEDGRLGPLSPGVVTLAMRTGVPVYPIVTVGSDKFLPRGAKWDRTAYKEDRYGKPLSFEPLNKHGEISVKEQVDAANERLRRALLELY